MNEPTPMDAIEAAFARGDYHRAAASGSSDRWQTHAALGLCGNTGPALEGLTRFESPDARFYEGVIRWIDGDEIGAIRLLAPCDNEHADNLLRLIQKPRISVLTQLPWQRATISPHTLLHAGQMDPKFHIENISFAKDDLRNEPNADIHTFYDASDPPDLYLAEMIEWHVIPPNLEELPCPIIGQTGDYDLHIQTVYPWLRLFDELVVTDSTEFADVSRLCDAPVTTFCKPVSLPLQMLPEIECERDLDLVLTGSLLHSYYPDKAEMMRQLLAAERLDPFFISGFLVYNLYYGILARSKMSVALTRHLGAVPSRGYEALAMGTVLLAPRESCLRLFAGDSDGVYPFSLQDNGLEKAVGAVLADYPRYAEGAQRGMRIIRDSFDPYRVASQYLRMSTFLAARPRRPREPNPVRPQQKRSVAYKGWLQENGPQTNQAIRNDGLERWKSIAPEDHTLDSFANPARELMLEYAFCTLMPDDQSHAPLVTTALNVYRGALEKFPDALALRFNFVRAAFHFGTEPDIEHALQVARETLEKKPAALTLDPLDDVMTWDYCQDFFNYRSYLQIVTEALCGGPDRGADLKALVLASLHYYFGRVSGEPGHFAAAATLDPKFSAYRLAQAKELDRNGDAASAGEAIGILSDVMREILFAPEAWSLMQSITSIHGIPIPDEAALRNLVDQMESRTLIDEAYAAIRAGPYFRAQRLSLARNTGVEFSKKSDNDTPVRLSILLSDTNGSRYRNLVASLPRQSLDRGEYEIIACDVFDRESPHIMELADTVILCGQSEHLYNRNAAFNFGLAEARGALVVFCDSDGMFADNALATLLASAVEHTDKNVVFVNTGGERGGRENLHTVALTRDNAVNAGGLDESAYYAGAYSGPHELVARLENQRWPIVPLDALPGPASGPMTAERLKLPKLFSEIWPSKFSPYRPMPLRESPDIARLRHQLR